MAITAIETEALTKAFGSQRGIADVDLCVQQGEIFGFLGPNGAGKSTTIRILMGLYLPTSGTARVLDLDPFDDAVEIHRRTGYLPGELALFERLTGAALIAGATRVRNLKNMSLRDDLVERFDVELDRPVRALSKGNRQKLGIVLAFMHRPELLVLDEPTSGLDPLLQAEFDRLLRETVDDGRTILLSSHDLDEVQRVVGRLAIIKEGRIVVVDTVDGLRQRSPRTIEVAFDYNLDPKAARILDCLDGVTVRADGARRLGLTYRGPVAPVLRAVADLNPVEFSAGSADLDELFIGYYRGLGTT